MIVDSFRNNERGGAPCKTAISSVALRTQTQVARTSSALRCAGAQVGEMGDNAHAVLRAIAACDVDAACALMDDGAANAILSGSLHAALSDLEPNSFEVSCRGHVHTSMAFLAARSDDVDGLRRLVKSPQAASAIFKSSVHHVDRLPQSAWWRDETWRKRAGFASKMCRIEVPLLDCAIAAHAWHAVRELLAQQARVGAGAYVLMDASTPGDIFWAISPRGKPTPKAVCRLAELRDDIAPHSILAATTNMPVKDLSDTVLAKGMASHECLAAFVRRCRCKALLERMAQCVAAPAAHRTLCYARLLSLTTLDLTHLWMWLRGGRRTRARARDAVQKLSLPPAE